MIIIKIITSSIVQICTQIRIVYVVFCLYLISNALLGSWERGLAIRIDAVGVQRNHILMTYDLDTFMLWMSCLKIRLGPFAKGGNRKKMIAGYRKLMSKLVAPDGSILDASLFPYGCMFFISSRNYMCKLYHMSAHLPGEATT